VYRAEDYDSSAAPGAQAASPIGDVCTLNGARITGIVSLVDGSLVFVVVSYAPGGAPTLAVSPTGRAYRDTAVAIEMPFQYRVVAVRESEIGIGVTRELRSLSSDAAEAIPYDGRPPVPPSASALWLSPQQLVEVAWSVANVPPGLEVMLLRSLVGDDYWNRATPWAPAASGSVRDAAVQSGSTYVYRLHVRAPSGRISENEPLIGPLSIP